MEVVRLTEREADWDGVVERVESGVTVKIMRGDQVLATVTPGEMAEPVPQRPTPHPSWKAAGIDWDEIRRFRDSLLYDPTNSVEEMRKQARY